jgi:C4-dicarboxylate-binding protein DctP
MRLLMALFLTAFLFPVVTARADETVLRLTLQQSAADPVGENVLSFKREVEGKTRGAVKVEIFDKGQFYQDYQVPEAIGGGAIEMGVTPLAQYAQYVSVAAIFMQPFLFNFDAIVQAAARPGGEIRMIVDGAILKQTGARVLWWQPNGWNVIFSKGPVAKPDAMPSRNMRVFDEVSAEFVTLCGGTPQIIPESKQVEALDLNLVDSTMTSISSIKNYELWHKTDTISDIRHSANIMVVIINDDIWQKLNEDEKTIVTNAARNAESASWTKMPSVEADIYSYANSKGMSLERPTADDFIAWRICSSSILESFMSRAGRAGAQLLTAYGKLRADPCCGSVSAARLGH